MRSSFAPSQRSDGRSPPTQRSPSTSQTQHFTYQMQGSESNKSGGLECRSFLVVFVVGAFLLETAGCARSLYDVGCEGCADGGKVGGEIAHAQERQSGTSAPIDRGTGLTALSFASLGATRVDQSTPRVAMDLDRHWARFNITWIWGVAEFPGGGTGRKHHPPPNDDPNPISYRNDKRTRVNAPRRNRSTRPSSSIHFVVQSLPWIFLLVLFPFPSAFPP
jgi:hypothetical protein